MVFSLNLAICCLTKLAAFQVTWVVVICTLQTWISVKLLARLYSFSLQWKGRVCRETCIFILLHWGAILSRGHYRILQERPWSWDVSIHLDHSHWQSVFYEEYKLRSVTPPHGYTAVPPCDSFSCTAESLKNIKPYDFNYINPSAQLSPTRVFRAPSCEIRACGYFLWDVSLNTSQHREKHCWIFNVLLPIVMWTSCPVCFSINWMETPP